MRLTLLGLCLFVLSVVALPLSGEIGGSLFPRRGGSSGHSSGGGGHSSGSSSGGKGGSSGGKGGSSSGSGHSGGEEGGGSSSGSSGGKGGSGGGKGGSSSSGENGGRSGGKGGSSNGGNREDPPPPYDSHSPPPYHAGSYGHRGSYRNGWNGQYYPYRSYGYGNALPFAAGLGAGAAPYYLAGPYGFYGPYGHGGNDNATVENLYASNSSSLYLPNFEDGEYLIHKYNVPGYLYSNGTSVGGGLYVNGSVDMSNENVTFVSTSFINPNYSANGTELEDDDSSAGVQLHISWAAAFVALLVFAL